MEYYSNCCEAPPVDELNPEEGYVILGYCSKCGNGAVFKEEIIPHPNSNYIGTSLDCHITEEEYEACQEHMMETFMCPLCDMPHWRVNGKLHSQCQIDDSQDYPEDWREI